MGAYWLSFRINEDGGYFRTFESLVEVIQTSLSGDWWCETTSFYAFESQLGIDDLASEIKSVIRIDRDLAILCSQDSKCGRVIGAYNDEGLLNVLPFMELV